MLVDNWIAWLAQGDHPWWQWLLIAAVTCIRIDVRRTAASDELQGQDAEETAGGAGHDMSTRPEPASPTAKPAETDEEPIVQEGSGPVPQPHPRKITLGVKVRGRTLVINVKF